GDMAGRTPAAATFAPVGPPDFLGLGVRIEDDLLVTADGHENLSAGSAVEPDAVEALCREASALPLFE
ncbi:MAG: hypothetical protein AB1Z98_01835, partial [Nannocystaceae bacterium]